MDRRTFLRTAAGFWAAVALARAAGSAYGNPGPGTPGLLGGLDILSEDAESFSRELLIERARLLSLQPFQPLGKSVPEAFAQLDYDQYRLINFDRRRSAWKDESLPFNLQFLIAGYLFREPIRLYIVEKGEARQVRYSPDLFIWDPKLTLPVRDSNPGFSGFRIQAPINRADKMDEIVVFQGASYFRGLATGQEYGLSARGLAINTGQPGGEEFPKFRDFWVEKPEHDSDEVLVHALLDSASVSGAYSFAISNRTSTLMDVRATLFPRKPIAYPGIAPLTSMFRSAPWNPTYYDDYRPRVYDSEALAILNGSGERIFRPLINPPQTQFSVFVDKNPKGFGLIQRNRNFRDFQDLQVRYDLRPSLWVEPLGDWGEGSVDLVELPTKNEYFDNIVAFWRPKEPLEPGKSYDFAYRLHWCWDPPLRDNVAIVTYTKLAKASKPGFHACHLDITAPTGFKFCDNLGAPCPNKRDHLKITASEGRIGEIYFEPNPVLGGYRLSFDFWTEDIRETDLRCVVLSQDRPISEIWTYRWTA